MEGKRFTVLVLGGGPDREREVSLKSAAQVADSLRQAGHQTIERDILPGDTSALDEKFDVVFPVLHGPFGEGGPLQEILERREFRFVGSGAWAARNAMDKYITKQFAAHRNLPTPAYERVDVGSPIMMEPPLVLKPLNDGSSVGVHICRDPAQVQAARNELHSRHVTILAEAFIKGRELTVGIVADQALPVIEIVPATSFYDYQAKYDRDDTQYRFDIDLPAKVLGQMQEDALMLYKAMRCRHLARADFIVDEQARHWMLEINTMPGFTTHSLLPMAARRAGIEMPELCDRIVQLAIQGPSGR